MFDKDKLGLEFGRALTADVAPEELPFYDELIAAPQQPQKRQDRSLGFGGEEALIGAVSVFLSVVGKTVISFIWQQVQAMAASLGKDAATELETRLSESLKKWIDARFSGPIPVKLPGDTAKELLESIRRDAVAKGVAEPELSHLMTTLSKTLA
jgi:hypothetical protein